MHHIGAGYDDSIEHVGLLVATRPNARRAGPNYTPLLRHQIIAAQNQPGGWLAALADPAPGKCLAFIHDEPAHEWSV
jgi:hypothetical protein